MYSLTVVFGTPATSWRFLFRSKEKADEVNGLLGHNPTQDIHIQDDFGQSADIKATSVHGRMLENLDESKIAYVEMALHNARVQASAQTRAGSDPELRAANRQAGPPIISPIGRPQ